MSLLLPSCVAVHENIFYLTWGQILQCAMWSLSIIELNIGVNSSLEVYFRCVVLTIDFLFFECSEKGFSHGIVMGFTGIGK